MLTWIATLAVGASWGAGLQLPPEGPAFASKLKTLVVFKEGFGFYVREGSATLEDGWATTNLVPQAIGGTFWVYPKDPADRVDTVVLTTDHRIDFEKPEELRSRLANKVGLRLRVTTETGVVTGLLTNLLDKMMLVRDEKENYVAIEYAKIKRVALSDFPVRIKLRTEKPGAKADLGIAYVQDGVKWTPSYLLELNGTSGRLTLRGTLLDLNEELVDANVVFVVGAPLLVNRGTVDSLLQGFVSGSLAAMLGRSIEFKNADPLVNSLAVRDSAKSAAPGALREGRGIGGGGGFGGGGFGGPMTSDETGELQYYTKSNFYLRPGERAMSMIFEIEIPIDPLFEWNADGDQVEYILTLNNKSSQPFTTGPVFVVEDLRPAGQQMMQYTAPGDKTELRLAQGIGLKVERAEKELKRGDPFRIGTENWLPITLEGRLTLENFRKEPAKVRIKRTLNGKLIDIGGGVVKGAEVANSGPNTKNSVEWNVTVAPGKKHEIVYSVETYTSMGR